MSRRYLPMLVLSLVACSESPLPTDSGSQHISAPAPRPMASASTSDIVALSGGDQTLCALTSDGAVKCSSRYAPLDGFSQTGLTQISVSYQGVTLCALKTDRTAACWGHNHLGEASPPAGEFTHIAMADFSACGLRPDRTVTCWGDPEGTNAPTDLFTTFDGGSRTYCGIRVDQTLKCWGLNYQGSLFAPAGTFKEVNSNALDGCALRTNGDMVCWGNSDVVERPGPFARITTSSGIECGIRADGSAECLGNGPYPFWDWMPDGQFGPMAGGLYWICGVTQSKLGCWGQQTGQTGITDAPVIRWGGPYSITEGSTLTMSAAGSSNRNGDALSFSWNMTQTPSPEDGTGPTLTWLFDRSGNAGVVIHVQDGLSRVYQNFQVTVTDVRPTATFIAPATVEPGAMFELRLDSVTDPSPADFSSMRAIFDCGAGTFITLPFRVYTTTCTAPTTPGTRHVRARLINTDGPSPIYLRDVMVTSNAPPVATLSVPSSVSEGAEITVSLINVSDEDVATLAYAFDCGSGYSAYGATNSTNCATTDNGSRVVRARIRDNGGLEAEYGATVAITDVPPVVNAFNGATILVGETYSAAGTFSGASVDTWSATVDYGSGAQSLPLAGSSFALSHQYQIAGTNVVTVRVTDDDGSVATRSATVVVESPQQASQSLSAAIDALLSSGAIDAGAANSMTSKLAAASQQFAGGNVNAGNNQLDAFMNQVRAQLRSGRLSGTQAQTLIDYAVRIKQSAAL